MKKIIISCLLITVIAMATFIALAPQPDNDYIRIHIRANSNSDYDQSVKYTVKDSVVAAITPLAKEITSYDKMYEVLGNNLAYIKQVVDNQLASMNIQYRSTINLNKETFPTRSYQDLTLEGGIYDALIIELGSGSGDNWWCVAFPPLCFVSENNGDDVEYRSIFDKLFRK